MLVELDDTVTRQNTKITNLIDTIKDFEAKMTKVGSLECRLSILELLQAGNIPKTLPPYFDTASTTHKST